MVELRAAANLSAGAEEPWVPPVEANRLSYAQRRALESFIKATVGPVDDAEEPPPEPPPPLDAQPATPALTEHERAEVESYISRLYASGRKDLADRLAASLETNEAHPAVEAATRPTES